MPKFFKQLGQRGVMHLIPLLIILAGIIAGVYLVQKSGYQIFKPKAYEKSPNPVLSQNASTFRDYILQAFGFTENATNFIKENSSIKVKDLSGVCSGGGGWYDPQEKSVILSCTQHEAAVHEFAHVWWHTERVNNPQSAKDLARDLVKLADGDGPEQAVAFAKTYVYGDRSWKGMYCTDNGCADVHNLLDSDFNLSVSASKAKIIDREIYAGLASWTMGQFKDGSRALPEYMWKYLEPLFTNNLQMKPYYEIGSADPGSTNTLEFRCEGDKLTALQSSDVVRVLYDCDSIDLLCKNSLVEGLKDDSPDFAACGFINGQFPTLKSPMGKIDLNSLEDPNNVKFEWIPIQGVDYYNLSVNDDQTHRNVKNIEHIYAASILIPKQEFISGHKYSGFITGINEEAKSEISSSYEPFFIINNQP